MEVLLNRCTFSILSLESWRSFGVVDVDHPDCTNWADSSKDKGNGLKLWNTTVAELATEESWHPSLCCCPWRHSFSTTFIQTLLTLLRVYQRHPLKLVSSPAWENHCPSVLGRGVFKTYINVEISRFIWIRNSKLGLSGLRHTTKTANNGLFRQDFSQAFSKRKLL